jgi:Holliday junction resolvasome RuvABC ATP-dependent DNA helicase subunit
MKLTHIDKELFPNIVGQESVKRQLGFYIQGYNSTNTVPHMMFTAPRGCGKTMIAKAFARNLIDKTTGKPKKFLELNCSTLKNVKQFFAQFVLPYMIGRDLTILFDEASEIPKDVTMALLTITNPNVENRNRFTLEEYTVDFDFTKLSFLFCTTEAQKVFHALMDRMERIDLEEYKYDELGEIVMRGLNGYRVDKDALRRISKVLRGNARGAQKMAQKLKLYMDGHAKKNLDGKDWKSLKYTLGILPLGLSKIELQLLNVLNARKECSLTFLAANTGLTKECIQRDYELFLQKQHLMEITTGGRRLTSKGKEYVDELDKEMKRC